MSPKSAPLMIPVVTTGIFAALIVSSGRCQTVGSIAVTISAPGFWVATLLNAWLI